MGLRVRALYQNSRPVLILIVATWIGTTVVGCVRVFPQCMIPCGRLI